MQSTRTSSGHHLLRRRAELSFILGDLEFQNCYVEVIEKGSVMGEDGLIGTDVFSDFLIDLDLRHSRLKLSQLPTRPDAAASSTAGEAGSESRRFHDRYVAPEMKAFTPVFRFGHQ